MRIAVVTETSTVARNSDIIAALEGRGHQILNVGMRRADDDPELTYINTGFLSALILNTGRVDFVIGGCGTGQGFGIAVSQYPNVCCGHVQSPLDAWLFSRINAGNCASLTLNQGYGWGSDVNLRLTFDQLFGGQTGAGYPAHRIESQRASRELLVGTSVACHRGMADIVRDLPDGVVAPVLAFPGVWELLRTDELSDHALAQVLNDRRQPWSGST